PTVTAPSPGSGPPTLPRMILAMVTPAQRLRIIDKEYVSLSPLSTHLIRLKEHTSPFKRRPTMTMDVALSEDLLIGADKIADFLYAKTDGKSLSHVYRNVAGLSFFKHGNSIAAFKSTIR